MIRAKRGGGSTAVEAAFVAALAFAFTNGFHDAANAIATLVATRGASPGAAIALAAVFNLLGPLLLGCGGQHHRHDDFGEGVPADRPQALDPWAWAGTRRRRSRSANGSAKSAAS
jgi:hypothetical protein